MAETSDSALEGEELEVPFLRAIARGVNDLRRDYPDLEVTNVDALFVAYLLTCSRFGRFDLGPISIDVGVVEDRFVRGYPRGPSVRGYAPDAKQFYARVSQEVARSGRRRVDELHWLLAFMRAPEGLPREVFAEIAVTPEEVEAYARGDTEGTAAGPAPTGRLHSPEDVAEYLGVHVQTVRAWIRSGKLPASRLAGQRALRVKESDIQRVLEPVDPDRRERPSRQGGS